MANYSTFPNHLSTIERGRTDFLLKLPVLADIRNWLISENLNFFVLLDLQKREQRLTTI